MSLPDVVSLRSARSRERVLRARTPRSSRQRLRTWSASNSPRSPEGEGSMQLISGATPRAQTEKRHAQFTADEEGFALPDGGAAMPEFGLPPVRATFDNAPHGRTRPQRGQHEGTPPKGSSSQLERWCREPRRPRSPAWTTTKSIRLVANRRFMRSTTQSLK